MSNLLTDRLLQVIKEKAEGKHTVFAKKSGIPPSTFQGYIQGRPPHIEHLVRIRETYNVNIDWLLTGEGEIYLSEKREISQIDDDPEIAELLEGARRVLKSGNSVAFDALERNIRYFDYAVATEKRLEAVEEKLEAVLDKLAKSNKMKKAANE